MNAIATTTEDSLVTQPKCCCIVRVDDATKFESALNIVGTEDPTMGYEVKHIPDRFMILGMGELHLEVLQHKLREDHGMIFTVLKKFAVVLLEPWLSLEINFPGEYFTAVRAELEHRHSEAFGHSPLGDVVFATADVSVKKSVGLFNKLKELTDKKGSYSSQPGEYRPKIDWRLDNES